MPSTNKYVIEDMNTIVASQIKRREKNCTGRYLRGLKYYAIFKVRKFESLFYKINTCLQETTTYTGLQAEQIFSINI